MKTLKVILYSITFLFCFTLKSSTLVGKVMIEDNTRIRELDFSKKLKELWGHDLDTSKISAAPDALAFEMDGEMVGIMSVSTPVPWTELELPCKYAFLWNDAASELKSHKAYFIVTILTGKAKNIERQKILTKLISVLLKLSKPKGVYIADRMLLISPADYLIEAESLKKGKLPLGNWILISMATKDGKSLAFTSGLEIFGFKEFEAEYKENQLVEVYKLLYNASHFVLTKYIAFKDGDQFGASDEKKYDIKEEKSTLFDQKNILHLRL